jgi:hypothetical protein
VASNAGDAKKGLLDLDDPLDSDADSGTLPRQTPTVVPRSFDPRSFIESHEEPDTRDKFPTLTDDEALEAARRASLPTSMPPARTAPPPSSWAPPPPSTDAAPAAASEAPDALIEIEAAEEDLDALDADEQEAILRARLAPMGRVPMLAATLSELGEVLADPKTAYVLGFVDGILPLETIVEVTGLPELETLRVLDRMIAQGVVVFRSPLSDR